MSPAKLVQSFALTAERYTSVVKNLGKHVTKSEHSTVLGAAPTPVISGGLKTEIVDAVRREIARFSRCRHQASGMWSLAL
jgi:hypothetical protein